jgi:hypothetical protein
MLPELRIQQKEVSVDGAFALGDLGTTCSTETKDKPTNTQTGSITRLPSELLLRIIRDLDRCSSACLGVTCKRLNDVHFGLYGPTRLNKWSYEIYEDDRDNGYWFRVKDPRNLNRNTVLRDTITYWKGRRAIKYWYMSIPVKMAWGIWNWSNWVTGPDFRSTEFDYLRREQQSQYWLKKEEVRREYRYTPDQTIRLAIDVFIDKCRELQPEIDRNRKERQEFNIMAREAKSPRKQMRRKRVAARDRALSVEEEVCVNPLLEKTSSC